MLDLPVPPLRIYTVSELNTAISALLDKSFGLIAVEGEVSNLRVPSSGHYYFTLKDEKSQIRAVLFKGQKAFIPFELKDGQKMICLGRLSLYSPRGEYQIILEQIEPSGLGSLHLAFEQLKERLEKEGLFDESRKKPLPVYPERIGIVTSPTGAAIRDILKVLERRNARARIVISPARVQGEGAAEEIARAIENLNRLGDIDAMIVGRGGGSMEDLWAFNEEIVARAIAHSSIPVISAVGHERDVTIADFVADIRAPTPSAAAEIVARSGIEALMEINRLEDRLNLSAQSKINSKKARLTLAVKGLRDPGKKLRDLRLRADELLFRIENRVSERIGRLRSELKGVAGRLDSLSPLSVLARGYSITTTVPEGKIVQDKDQVNIGDRVRIRLKKGGLQCNVEEKLPGND